MDDPPDHQIADGNELIAGSAPLDRSLGEQTRSEHRASSGRSGAHRAPAHAISRRRFLGRAGAAGAVVAAGIAGIGTAAALGDNPLAAGPTPGSSAAGTKNGARGQARTSGSGSGGTTPPEAPTTDAFVGITPDGVLVPMARRIVRENQLAGTPWWISQVQVPRSIEGFADKVSATPGEDVTVFVNTTATSFHVEAYRMGYYQGIGGRLVWRSEEQAGLQQPPPQVVPGVNTIQCPWSPSLSFPVGVDWVPGAYLLKLVGSAGEQQFVPLCVRDDTSTAAFVVQHSVTTWQAYNRWGGNSLYYGNPGGQLSFVHQPGPTSTFADRARIVSFDRPYDWDWASGAADFLGNELPVVYNAEMLGLDVTYWTDIDLHLRPQLLANHRCLFSLGHDEYWSLPMRQGAAAALAGGTNLAFLGANACYRQIRLQDSPVGPHRLQVCYKDAAEDPLDGVDDALVTAPTWDSVPTDWAESQLIGSMYQDVGAQADMVVTDPTHWIFSGTDLTEGQHLPGVIVGEFDRYDPNFPSPANADVIAHSPIANRGNNYSDVTWYTQAGGGGVFASGNATWVGSLSDTTGFPTDIVPAPRVGVTAPLLRCMQNLYSVLGAGPASSGHASSGTWQRVYTGSGPTPGPVGGVTA